MLSSGLRWLVRINKIEQDKSYQQAGKDALGHHKKGCHEQDMKRITRVLSSILPPYAPDILSKNQQTHPESKKLPRVHYISPKLGILYKNMTKPENFKH